MILKKTMESEIISRFLNALGDINLQLAGYILANANLKKLGQKATTNSVQTTKLAKRAFKH